LLLTCIQKGKKGKAKGKTAEKSEEDSFKVDVSDPRFAAMYDRPDFAIDRTDAKYPFYSYLLHIHVCYVLSCSCSKAPLQCLSYWLSV